MRWKSCFFVLHFSVGGKLGIDLYGSMPCVGTCVVDRSDSVEKGIQAEAINSTMLHFLYRATRVLCVSFAEGSAINKPVCSIFWRATIKMLFFCLASTMHCLCE